MTQKPDYFGDNITPAERKARRQKREAEQEVNNRRLGILIFQISWIMAFVALVIVNWQLRFQYESWPPPNVEAMGVLLPTLATILLFGGVVAARRARRAAETEQTDRFINLWSVAVGTGGVFVIIMAYEWWHVGVVDVEGTQYQSVFRLMTGFHMLHAVVVGAWMGNILNNAVQARQYPDELPQYGPNRIWPVEAAVHLWDFVFVAWLLFYVVLYWWRSV
ncbi:MAG: cytochrome c oxidase subunit 3 [Chloroflexota bacterium]